MLRALVVEDSTPSQIFVGALLESLGILVETAGDAEAALQKQSVGEFDLVLTDFSVAGTPASTLIQALRANGRVVPVIITSAFGSIPDVVEVMRAGASYFLPKPLESLLVLEALRKVLGVDLEAAVAPSVRGSAPPSEDPVWASPAMGLLLKDVKKVSRGDSSVLLTGESGVGKEVLARYIHSHWQRRGKTFAAINCAAIPDNLLESELFGHEQGAFTGASDTHIGLFEQASEGTLFLDEIGEMPLNLQVKLLRSLQEKRIRRVGGTKEIAINPRVIAATNKCLTSALKNRTFREDLYYRLAVITFEIPPLRDRPEDIRALVDHFSKIMIRKHGRSVTFSQEGLAALEQYHWPGNIRELANLIERLSLLCEHDATPDDLGIVAPNKQPKSRCLHDITETAQRRVEREAIAYTLRESRGNKAAAARKLGVSYKTLLSKIKDLGIAGVEERPE